MKNIYKLSIISVLSLVLFAGCALKPTSLATQQSTITSAAAIGTSVELGHNPQYAPYFVAGSSALKVIAGETNQLSASSLEDALKTAGQTNPIVNVAIISAINLGDSYINQGTNSTSQVAALKSVASWVAIGIDEGLTTVPVAK